MGMGFIARDCHGEILGTKCVAQTVRVEPSMAKVMVALYAIQFCKEVGFFAMIFEGDAKEIVRRSIPNPLICPELVILLRVSSMKCVVAVFQFFNMFIGILILLLIPFPKKQPLIM